MGSQQLLEVKALRSLLFAAREKEDESDYKTHEGDY